MLIKILLVAALLAIAGLLLRAPHRARHLALRRLLLMLFAVGAALSVVYPHSWNVAAQFVGVGRGTDLLLYALIVAFLGFVATSYLRFRQVEARVTLLARRLALDEVGSADRHRRAVITPLSPVAPVVPAPAEAPVDLTLDSSETASTDALRRNAS